MLDGYMAKSRLAEARKKAGLTQQELADAVGAHWTTISRLETGKLPMSFAWAKKIGEIVHIPWELLMGGEVDPQVVYVQCEISNAGRNVYGYYQAGNSLVALPTTGSGFWALVKDESFFPQFRQGDLLHFTAHPIEKIDELLGRTVMLIVKEVAPIDFFGTLARGINRDRYCVRNTGAPDSVDLDPDIVALADIHYLQPRLLPTFNPEIVPEVAKGNAVKVET